MGLKITMCSWGKFWTQMIQRPKNPTAISEELGAKTWVSGAKADYCTCHLHSASQRGGQTTYATPLPSPQRRNEITTSQILRGTGAPLKPCLNLSALSRQFLLTGEGQESWWVSLIRYPATIRCFANFSQHGSQKQKYLSVWAELSRLLQWELSVWGFSHTDLWRLKGIRICTCLPFPQLMGSTFKVMER